MSTSVLTALCQCTTCMPGAQGGQKRVQILWNWSYGKVVSLGNEPRFSAGVTDTLNH